MKIAFLIPTLGRGGAERVASILCSEWAHLGHQVDLLTYVHDLNVPAYRLADSVNWHDLGKSLDNFDHLVWRNIHRVWAIGRCIAKIKPDILVSFLTEANVAAILVAKMNGVPVVISERVHPQYHPRRMLDKIFQRALYRFSDCLVVQTKDIAQWCRKNFHARTHVVPNPYRAPGRDGSSIRNRRHVIVGMGRLERQKGFDILIDAFASLASSHLQWDVEIFGEGTERLSLVEQIERAGLKNRVRLMGVTAEPESILRDAEIYCHPARYEGFSNALMEALGNGCCVVAANSPGATAEVLDGGKFGLLLAPNDSKTLAGGLAMAMESIDLRRGLQQSGPQQTIKFAPELVSRTWIQLFEHLLDVRKKRSAHAYTRISLRD